MNKINSEFCNTKFETPTLLGYRWNSDQGCTAHKELDPSHPVPVYIVREGGRARGDRALSDSQLSASSVMSTLLLVHNSFPSSVQTLSPNTTSLVLLVQRLFWCSTLSVVEQHTLSFAARRLATLQNHSAPLLDSIRGNPK